MAYPQAPSRALHVPGAPDRQGGLRRHGRRHQPEVDRVRDAQGGDCPHVSAPHPHGHSRSRPPHPADVWSPAPLRLPESLRPPPSRRPPLLRPAAPRPPRLPPLDLPPPLLPPRPLPPPLPHDGGLAGGGCQQHVHQPDGLLRPCLRPSHRRHLHDLAQHRQQLGLLLGAHSLLGRPGRGHLPLLSRGGRGGRATGCG
ncbi:hypothetical protein Naga_101890g1, partial [Nannochloropsis gaditana]